MRRIQRDLDLEAMLLETDETAGETAGETADRYVTRDRRNNISVSVAWSAIVVARGLLRRFARRSGSKLR